MICLYYMDYQIAWDTSSPLKGERYGFAGADDSRLESVKDHEKLRYNMACIAQEAKDLKPFQQDAYKVLI